MTTFGYCRVSTSEQDTAIQEADLKKACPDIVIRTEKQSGTSADDRPVLQLLMDMISKGDTLIVWKLDRLARNMRDLLSLVERLETKGAALRVLDQNIDTSTAAGTAFLQMLGVFAEFETNLRKERQMAGIEKAKAAGKYKGRNPVSDDQVAQVVELLKQGLSKAEVVRRSGVGRTKVFEIAKQLQ